MPEGGWKSQPIALKLMLPLSLILVFLGVYRCSMELTPVDDPGVVRVERAAVDVPDSVAVMSADSLSALATRMFVREFREASAAAVTLEDDPTAWAVVTLRLRGTTDGLVELGTVARSAATRRPLAASTLSDSLYRVRELTADAARVLAEELNVARSAEATAEATGEAPDDSLDSGER